MNLVTRCSFLALVSLVGGCAPQYAILGPARDISSFELVDSRPVEERDGKRLPYKGRFNHSIYGDDRFTLNRLALLKVALEDSFGARLKSKRVEVKMFRLLSYSAPVINLDAIIFPDPPAESLGIRDRYRSWFITEITVLIDGKMFTGRYDAEVKRNKERADVSAMQDSVALAIKAVVADIATRWRHH